MSLAKRAISWKMIWPPFSKRIAAEIQALEEKCSILSGDVEATEVVMVTAPTQQAHAFLRQQYDDVRKEHEYCTKYGQDTVYAIIKQREELLTERHMEHQKFMAYKAQMEARHRK